MATTGQAGAPLQGFHIRDGILKNGFAADRAALSRSCQSPRVRWVRSRAFQATIACRESARKNAPASRETRAFPSSGITLDVLCSEDKTASPPQRIEKALRSQCFPALLHLQFRGERPARTQGHASL